MNPRTAPGKTARVAKRAQFESNQDRKFPARWIAIVAVVLLLAGGAYVALSQRPAQTAAAPASAPTAAQGNEQKPSNASLVKAATVGHAPYAVLEAVDGNVRLPLATFDDRQAHYYTFVLDGKPVEFFILESKDGVVRAAFNACDVCYPFKKGYTQDGDEVVCNNCGRRFPADQINVVQGGCNPSPLKRTVEGSDLIIRVEDIATGIKYF